MTDPKVPALPRQLMMFDAARLRDMSAPERQATVTALASLLTEAAGPGGGDDER